MCLNIELMSLRRPHRGLMNVHYTLISVSVGIDTKCKLSLQLISACLTTYISVNYHFVANHVMLTIWCPDGD